MYFCFYLWSKNVDTKISSEFVSGESIGEIDRDDDTDERISLPNDDDGEIVLQDDEVSGHSSCIKWHRGP
jgi:hypothetical protein